jgi:hypothetical protein
MAMNHRLAIYVGFAKPDSIFSINTPPAGTDGTVVESHTVVKFQVQRFAGMFWEGRFLRRSRLFLD